MWYVHVIHPLNNLQKYEEVRKPKMNIAGFHNCTVVYSFDYRQ